MGEPYHMLARAIASKMLRGERGGRGEKMLRKPILRTKGITVVAGAESIPGVASKAGPEA